MHILPQLWQFWNTFPAKLGDECPYPISIGIIHLRLQELQESNSKAQKIRVAGLQEGWKELDKILHYQGLPYVPKIVRLELINRHYDDPLTGYFGVNKTKELIGRKYY